MRLFGWLLNPLTMMNSDTPKIFLISPANVSGKRAQQLRSPRATFRAAVELRSDRGVSISDAFTFMSALYFRGKITYARTFESPPTDHSGIFIITAGQGLVHPDWRFDLSMMRRFARTKIDRNGRTYRRALLRDVRTLLETVSSDTQFVLLGSLATGKYVDVLLPVLAERLVYPACFPGMGDMKRGATLLEAARDGVELDYAAVRPTAKGAILAPDSPSPRGF